MVRLTERRILLWDGAVEVAVLGAGVGGVALLWPNSWANLTSFQMPTDELTTKVLMKVATPAMAWST